MTIEVLGRKVTFSNSDENRVSLIAHEPGRLYSIQCAMKNWERRGRYSEGQYERENLANAQQRLLNKDITVQFLQFFLKQPVGIPLCIFDSSIPFERYRARVEAFNEAILTWDAITHWERQADGKLKSSISCAGFLSRLPKFDIRSSTVYRKDIVLRTLGLVVGGRETEFVWGDLLAPREM